LRVTNAEGGLVEIDTVVRRHPSTAVASCRRARLGTGTGMPGGKSRVAGISGMIVSAKVSKARLMVTTVEGRSGRRESWSRFRLCATGSPSPLNRAPEVGLQAIAVPAVTGTLVGPVVPEKRVPPMSSRSAPTGDPASASVGRVKSTTSRRKSPLA